MSPQQISKLDRHKITVTCQGNTYKAACSEEDLQAEGRIFYSQAEHDGQQHRQQIWDAESHCNVPSHQS